jgi:hypothetical protein
MANTTPARSSLQHWSRNGRLERLKDGHTGRHIRDVHHLGAGTPGQPGHRTTNLLGKEVEAFLGKSLVENGSNAPRFHRPANSLVRPPARRPAPVPASLDL